MATTEHLLSRIHSVIRDMSTMAPQATQPTASRPGQDQPARHLKHTSGNNDSRQPPQARDTIEGAQAPRTNGPGSSKQTKPEDQGGKTRNRKSKKKWRRRQRNDTTPEATAPESVPPEETQLSSSLEESHITDRFGKKCDETIVMKPRGRGPAVSPQASGASPAKRPCDALNPDHQEHAFAKKTEFRKDHGSEFDTRRRKRRSGWHEMTWWATSRVGQGVDVTELATDPWRPDDLKGLRPNKLHQKMRDTINQHIAASFRNFGLSMSVKSVRGYDRSETVDVDPGTQSFVLEWNDGGRQRVLARLSKTESKQGEVEIQLSKPGNWPRRQLLIDFLGLLPPIEPAIVTRCGYDTSKDAYERQAEWWSKTGKPFRIFDLPLELRNVIYSYIIGPYVYPYPGMGRGRSMEIMRSGARDYVGLAEWKAQTRNEIREQMYTATPFLCETDRVLTRLIGNPHFPLRRLKHLELAMPHHNFLRFFGVHLQGKDEASYRPSRAAATIRELRLTTLVLRIPKKFGLCGILDCEWLNKGCQMKAVDMILQVAWPYIKGQMSIALEGCARKSQKDEFHRIVAEEYKWRLALEEKGLDYFAHEAVGQMARAMRVQMTEPLECEDGHDCNDEARWESWMNDKVEENESDEDDEPPTGESDTNEVEA